MIEDKVLILGIPFVAPKELVTAVASKKCFNTMIASEYGTVIRTDCRRVAKRLIKVGDNFVDRIRSILRRQEFFVMFCTKSTGDRASEFDLTITGFLERDGEGLRWPMHFAGKRNDRTTVCSTAQIAS